MEIRLLIFGPAALAHGGPEVRIALTDQGPMSEAAVRDAIATQHADIAPFARAGRLAVNGRYAPPSLRLDPGDEVALIALVSGG